MAKSSKSKKRNFFAHSHLIIFGHYLIAYQRQNQSISLSHCCLFLHESLVLKKTAAVLRVSFYFMRPISLNHDTKTVHSLHQTNAFRILSTSFRKITEILPDFVVLALFSFWHVNTNDGRQFCVVDWIVFLADCFSVRRIANQWMFILLARLCLQTPLRPVTVMYVCIFVTGRWLYSYFLTQRCRSLNVLRK